MIDRDRTSIEPAFWHTSHGVSVARQAVPLVRARHRARAGGEPASIEALAYCHGRTYDSYLATEPDRQVFWSSDSSGAVAYRRDGRYIHVAGGLLAPVHRKAALWNELVCWAEREHLVLSFYNLSDDDLPLARLHGFQVTKWGEEALVDLPECAWTGKPYEWVRRQSNFCRRQGIVARECDESQMTAVAWQRVAQELVDISQAQLVNKPQGDEIHFLEGRFDPAHMGRRRLFVAQQGAGQSRIEAFVVCNPGRDGALWAFETYRRRPDAVRGAMPFLMHQAMQQLQAEGAAAVSLCLVPGLRCETPLAGDSRLARWSVVLATRYFSFIHDTRGMYHYKSRFRPRFENRYLAVRPRLSLGSAWSFVRMLGVLDLRAGSLLRQAAQRLRSAASRRTLSRPDTEG
jgi:phosphatidylglycerol lysyltransferase